MDTRIVVDCAANTAKEVVLTSAEKSQRTADIEAHKTREADRVSRMAARERTLEKLANAAGVAVEDLKEIIGVRERRSGTPGREEGR